MAELWRAARRAAGWALGFGVVLGVASAIARGRGSTIKAAMKATLRLRGAAAEAAERLRDVYAEASSEQDAQHPANEGPETGLDPEVS